MVALVAHGAHEAVQGLHGRVGEVVQHAAARLSRAAEGIGRLRRGHGAAARSAPAASRAVVRALGRHGVAHEAVDNGAGTRVVRERGAHDGVVGGVAADALDAALDAHGALHVRLHEAHRLPEAWLERGLRRDVLRVLAAHVRLEHGRQQAFQRPVVGVGHVGERLFRRYGRAAGFGHVAAHAHAASGRSRACCQPNAPSTPPACCPPAAPSCRPAGPAPRRPPAPCPVVLRRRVPHLGDAGLLGRLHALEQAQLAGDGLVRAAAVVAALRRGGQVRAQALAREIRPLAGVAAVAGDEEARPLVGDAQLAQLALAERGGTPGAHDGVRPLARRCRARARAPRSGALFTSTGKKSRLLSAQFAFGSTSGSRNGCSSSMISVTSKR